MKSSTFICVECGTEFEATQTAKYCSQACKAKHINRAKAMFQCVYCGNTFEGSRNQKPKFCSRECIAKCRAEIRKNPNSPLNKYMTVSEPHEYTRVCIVCGTSFTTKSASRVNRYCAECKKKYGTQWAQRVADWNKQAKRMSNLELEAALKEQGLVVTPGEPQSAKSKAQSPHVPNQTRQETNAKRRVRRAQLRALGLVQPYAGMSETLRNTYITNRPFCACCGFRDDIDALQVHHIDMNRSNNEESNLCVLCANCHSVLHKRIKRNLRAYGDHKIEGIKKELECLKAEVKSRNEAGTPDRETRTEGVWQQASGATHTGRADSVISPHEAATPCDHGEKIC